MADNRFTKPLNIGHQTTLNLARKGTYDTTSLIGRKRPLDEVSGFQYQTRTTLSELKNEHTKNDFVRPSANGHPSTLKASTIHDVSPAGTQSRGISEYSQRRLLASTPTATVDPSLSLSHYNLPEKLVQNLLALGVKSIYPWQRNCLKGDPDILRGTKNLVYTAPTGGGKSLIADVLMLKKVIENPDKKGILVLPYVALVQEKTRWLRNVVDGVVKNVVTPDTPNRKPSMWKRRGDEDSLKIVGLHGGSRRTSWADMDIAICTIEKVSYILLIFGSQSNPCFSGQLINQFCNRRPDNR